MGASGPVKRIFISELPRELTEADDEEVGDLEEGAAEASDYGSQEVISSKDKMIKAKTKITPIKPGPAPRGRGGKRGRGK